MKNLILIILFLLIGVPSLYSQIKDTIFIKFDDKLDLIKTNKKENSNIWLYNILYKEELMKYKREIKKYEKDSLLPPQIFYPVKPNQYFKYFLTDKAHPCDRLIKIDCGKLDFFDRKKLRILNPYKKLIFVVKKENDSVICFPVSFYKNTIE